MESVREFFETLEGRVDPARTAGLSNSYVFDIAGAGAWTVDVKEGAVHVREGAEEADCVISTSEETFQRIANGQQNPMTAYMTGKLKIKGDLSAATKLQKLF